MLKRKSVLDERFCEYPVDVGSGVQVRCLKCSTCTRNNKRSMRELYESEIERHTGRPMIAPSCDDPVRFVVDGERKLLPCRKCERCVRRKHTDYGGRALAEATCSDEVLAVTLTYAPWTGARSQTLVYRDFQKLIKRLRKAGHNVRYLVAGEYGSKRQRAHWHAILFFRGKAPEMPPLETEKVHWDFWREPHGDGKRHIGFVYVQRPDYFGLLYLLKYAVKDEGTGRSTRHCMMSKRPPLGADYWEYLARERIEAGLPFSFEYRLEGARFGNGKQVRFYLGGASARLAWDAYRKVWYENPANRWRVPPVCRTEHDAWFRRVLPPKLRQCFQRGEHSLPTRDGGRRDLETCRKVLTIGSITYYWLYSGDIIGTGCSDEFMNQWSREGFRVWRVEGIREILAARRAAKAPEQWRVRRGEPPF